MLRLGFCITPHGFGHAARICAIIQSLIEKAHVEITIVTQVPEWFFLQSFSAPFCYCRLNTDVGMMQQSALHEDVAATQRSLQDFYPLSSQRISKTAGFFKHCDLVVCDVAPLGIVAARELGVPSVLIENFTWDWIYASYARNHPKFSFYSNYLSAIYDQADYRVQTTPVCAPGKADLLVPPVSRKSKGTVDEIRKRLSLEGKKTVLVTMGGGEEKLPLATMGLLDEYTFILPGTQETGRKWQNIVHLGKKTALYHPDLVAACDVVIGKVGYSTLAEVYQGNTAFGYVARTTFPESPPLEEFIEQNISSFRIPQDCFSSGTWCSMLDALFLPSEAGPASVRANGCDQIADFLLSL